MYYVVTGAAGFIGSNLVKALNRRGIRDIIAVDNLAHGDKFENLVDCEIADYLDKDEFLLRLTEGEFDDDIARTLESLRAAGVQQPVLGFRAPSFTIVASASSALVASTTTGSGS